MVALFAAIMVVNAFAAVDRPPPGRAAPAVAARRDARTRSSGSRRRGGGHRRRRSVSLLGLLASLATIVPFAVARHEGVVPDGQLWLPPLLVAGVGRAHPRRGPRRGAPGRGPSWPGRRDADDRLARDACSRRSRRVRPAPVDGDALVDRLRLTAVSLGYALAMAPALALAIVLDPVPSRSALVGVGFVLALAVVPATAALTGAAPPGQRRAARRGDPGRRTPTRPGTNLVTRPVRWLRDRARWRDVGFLWFSATGGFVHVGPAGRRCWSRRSRTWSGLVVDGGGWWWLLVVLDGPLLLAWWCVTPRAGARPGRSPSATSSAHARVEQLERRVEEVADVAQPRRSTTAPPRCAGSSATCTTAPRPGSPRSA